MEKSNIKHDNFKLLLESYFAWRKVIDKMDHIFINKLAILRSKHADLNETIPCLLKGYHLAIEHKLMSPEIDQSLLDDIHNIANLQDETESLFKVLDAVHSFCDKLLDPYMVKPLSAKHCIDKALDMYEFKNNERQLINFKGGSDFNLSIPGFFLNAALIQLLNFALNIFKESPQKKIEIYLSNQNISHAIHFIIACPEIQAQYNHFFENSLSVFPDKIMPGINFCRLAFLSAGGNMTYQAAEGKELEFVISLP